MGKFLFWKWDEPVKDKFRLIEMQADRIAEMRAFVKDLMAKFKGEFWIILPGGAAWGRDQMGYLYYMWQIGLLDYVYCFAGTSVGGLNALCMDDIIAAMELWNGITETSDVFLGDTKPGVGMAWQFAVKNKGVSVLDPAPIYQKIDKMFGNKALKDLKVNVMIAVSDLTSGERFIFTTKTHPNYKSADLAKATSAIEGVVPGVWIDIDGKPHLCGDGGAGRNNTVGVVCNTDMTHSWLIGTCGDKPAEKAMENKALPVIGRTVELVMHALEEDAWDEKAEYEKYHELAPDKYPKKIINDTYPPTPKKPSIDFNNVEDMQNGYERAFKEITKQKLMEVFGG